jgi:hypothetical protein
MASSSHSAEGQRYSGVEVEVEVEVTVEVDVEATVEVAVSIVLASDQKRGKPKFYFVYFEENNLWLNVVLYIVYRKQLK